MNLRRNVTNAIKVGVVSDGGTLTGLKSIDNPSLAGDATTLYRTKTKQYQNCLLPLCLCTIYIGRDKGRAQFLCAIKQQILTCTVMGLLPELMMKSFSVFAGSLASTTPKSRYCWGQKSSG